MPLGTDVMKIHQEVRAFFKGREKSGNKAYFPPFGKEVLAGLPTPISSEEMAGIGDKALAKLARKHATRNQNVLQNHSALRTLQAGDRDPILRGLQTSLQVSGDARVGNCYEMACMAAWSVVTKHFAYNAAMCGISDPGDPAFCIVWEGTTPAPKWQSVQELSKETRAIWALDPWANVCCLLSNYEAEFTKKMNQWTSQGKRIWQKSKTQKRKGWHVPNGKLYLTGFRTGPVRFNLVMEPLLSTSSPAPAFLFDKLSENSQLFLASAQQDDAFEWLIKHEKKQQRQAPAFVPDQGAGRTSGSLPDLLDPFADEYQPQPTGPAFKKAKTS